MSAAYEGLIAALQGIKPLKDAACTKYPPQLFDAETDLDAELACSICARCPAATRAECARVADTLGPNQIHGVWAGRRYYWTPNARIWTA